MILRFNYRKLIPLTFLLAILPLFSFDDDYQAAIHSLMGFSYTLILWFSLRNEISAWRGVLVVVALGIINLMIFYFALPLMLLPSNIASVFVIPWLSFIGAIFTIFLLSKFWQLKFETRSIYLLLGVVVLVSLLSLTFKITVLDIYFKDNVTIAMNIPFWLLAFSLALMLIDNRESLENG